MNYISCFECGVVLDTNIIEKEEKFFGKDSVKGCIQVFGICPICKNKTHIEDKEG